MTEKPSGLLSAFCRFGIWCSFEVIGRCKGGSQKPAPHPRRLLSRYRHKVAVQRITQPIVVVKS
ncbi:MAG: hypothetical protein RMK89_02225 [Armatimonadota bacterium]|nr:hypothetical protein [Armatimonadota bacterium]MDW8142258.1 hypothetical protein [Armatimonadota bacterium]